MKTRVSVGYRPEFGVNQSCVLPTYQPFERRSMPKLGEAVASWLARGIPERALRVRALAGDIVLGSWARHFTLMVLLFTQVYKWVPANLMLGYYPAMDQHPRPASQSGNTPNN